MLTLLKQSNYSLDVFDAQSGFLADLGIAVTSLLEALDVVEQVDRAVLPAGKVFDQAHHHAVLCVSLHHQGRDLALAKHLVRLQPTLAADEIVPNTIRFSATGDRNRFLQTEFGNVRYDFLEDFFVTNP